MSHSEASSREWRRDHHKRAISHQPCSIRKRRRARGGDERRGPQDMCQQDLVSAHAYIPSNHHVHMARCRATAAGCMPDTSYVPPTMADKCGGTALDA